jgi:hypothetical protein
MNKKIIYRRVEGLVNRRKERQNQGEESQKKINNKYN